MLTTEEARRLTERIQLGLDGVAAGVETVVDLIERARAGEAHQALGYPSWTAYVADRFGGVWARLDKVDRVRVVELMSGQGMSTRAIGSVVGFSKDTVARDLRSGVSADTSVALDGEHLTLATDATGEGIGHAALTESPAQGGFSLEGGEQAVVAMTKGIVGLDGKRYPSQKPTVARQKSLPMLYRRTVFDLDQGVRKLEKYHADDRYRSNRKALDGCADLLEKHGSKLLELADELRGGLR